MKAIRLRAPPVGGQAFSATNFATSASLELRSDLPKPTVAQSGEVLIAIKATTVTRGSLGWPELYAQPGSQMGNDFAGIVAEVHPEETTFRAGDSVYGMTSAQKGGAWAEYVLVDSEEAYKKPEALSWEEAAAIPMSALTADQALFDHGGLDEQSGKAKRILVTGAAGSVGTYVVQFAAFAGHHVIAGSSSARRNHSLLTGLGAKECIEYDQISTVREVDIVIDTVGGKVLSDCWSVVRTGGRLISVETHSWNFVEDRKRAKIADGKENQIHAKFFIVEPSWKSMERISDAVTESGLRGRIARTFLLSEAQLAYDFAESGRAGTGKIVLTVDG